MEFVLAFSSTNRVIYAEHLLGAEGIPVGVMPLPATVRAGCGLCLRIEGADVSRALALLKDGENTPSDVYTRESGDAAAPLIPWGGERNES